MLSENGSLLAEVIDRYFGLFQPTISLVEGLISRRQNPQEVMLLLCARLDALASCISNEERGNRESCVELVTKFGGHRDLMQAVSVADLYYELGFHRWMMDGILATPGRVIRFSRLSDPLVELLDLSGIPLTSEAATRMLSALIAVLKRNFRCHPGQRLAKPPMVKKGQVLASVQTGLHGSRAVKAESLGRALQPLLDSVTVADLLYLRVRNGAIHGIEVNVDENRFFTEKCPYWHHLHSEYYGSFMLLQFPAQFLLELLQNSLETLRRAMLARGLVPPDVHWHLFGDDHLATLKFLDMSLLPQTLTLGIQRARSR